MVRCTQMFSFLLHLTYWREKKNTATSPTWLEENLFVPAPVVSWLLVPLPLRFMIQKKKTQEKLKCKGNSFIRKPCPPSVLKTISWYRTFVWIELQIYLIFASCSSWVGLSLPSISLLNLYFRALSHGIRFTTAKLTSYMSIEKYSTHGHSYQW